jgi:hypothetical protein
MALLFLKALGQMLWVAFANGGWFFVVIAVIAFAGGPHQ